MPMPGSLGVPCEQLANLYLLTHLRRLVESRLVQWLHRDTVLMVCDTAVAVDGACDRRGFRRPDSRGTHPPRAFRDVRGLVSAHHILAEAGRFLAINYDSVRDDTANGLVKFDVLLALLDHVDKLPRATTA